MDDHVFDPAAFPVVQAAAPFGGNTVRQDLLPVKQGKDEYRVRTGPGPDLPGSVVDMIQMVVCAEKCVHPFHFLHGNRRRNLPFRKPGGKIIDAEDG